MHFVIEAAASVVAPHMPCPDSSKHLLCMLAAHPTCSRPHATKTQHILLPWRPPSQTATQQLLTGQVLHAVAQPTNLSTLL